jgi:hypothetical protein
MKMKKKVEKKSKASFQDKQTHSDKLSAYKAGSLGTDTNRTGGPTNRADNELKSMMTRKPSGLAQSNRRKK